MSVTHTTANGTRFVRDSVRYMIPVSKQAIDALRTYDRIVLGGSLNYKIALHSKVWQQVQYAHWDGDDYGMIYVSLDEDHDTPEEREAIAAILADHLELCMKVSV